jgi:lipopolysaccharide/colanic/teichoic acid biosynthesis glycosyltransferase
VVASRIPEPRTAAIALELRRPAAAHAGFYPRYGKRSLDLVLGVVLLLISTPLVLSMAFAVLLTSGWPVLYASERIGRNGRRFSMWKFRTMVRDADAVMEQWKRSHPERAAEYQLRFKLKDDPRITPLGAFLRKSSLDELPQFWNVIRGDMSLVGPRPYLPTLAPDRDVEDAVLSLRPAITGPFQVSGRNAMSPRRRMTLDADYAANVTLFSDAAYLLRTLRPLLRLDGD